MVNFLLLIKNIFNYSKKDIDKGKTPPEIYKLCSCIKETFCLSYAIRKDNNLLLYFLKENVLIKFSGKKLRYLGSDERSQALLIEKALSKIKRVPELENTNWINSTPGIYIKKFHSNKMFINHLKSMEPINPIFILDNFDPTEVELYPKTKEFEILDDLEKIFYIIPTYPFSKNHLNFIHLLEELKNIKFINLSKIRAVEDKILYINFRIDQQGNINK